MNFVDRVSTYPNRYTITDENGNASHVLLERADEPITPGTPLNAETFNQMYEDLIAEFADYVVDEGTSGNWTYRKWSDGTAECWSKQTLSCGLKSGSVTVNFPFPFTEPPVVTMSAESMPIHTFVGTIRCNSTGPNGGMYDSTVVYDRYEGLIGLFQLSSEENATVSSVSGDVTFNVYCIGKWK